MSGRCKNWALRSFYFKYEQDTQWTQRRLKISNHYILNMIQNRKPEMHCVGVCYIAFLFFLKKKKGLTFLIVAAMQWHRNSLNCRHIETLNPYQPASLSPRAGAMEPWPQMRGAEQPVNPRLSNSTNTGNSRGLPMWLWANLFWYLDFIIPFILKTVVISIF